MTELAKEYGCEFFVRLAEAKTDITNILLAIRLLRMRGSHINFGYFKRMSLPTAKLGDEFFMPAFDEEAGSAEEREEALVARLRHTHYAGLADMLGAAGIRFSLSVAEKLCDDFYLGIAKSAKNVLYGPEPLGAYIVAASTRPNIRIIAAGKLSGSRAETIKERLRLSYA